MPETYVGAMKEKEVVATIRVGEIARLQPRKLVMLVSVVK